MYRLSSKMKTAQETHPSCAMWFPFNEGSGNNVTDLVTGTVQADNATAEHTTPHGIQLTASGATETNNIPQIPAGKSIVVLSVMKAGVLAQAGLNATFGDAGPGASNIGIGSSGAASVKLTAEAPVSANYDNVANGQISARGFTFNGATGTLNSYSGINGTASALDNTADASVHIISTAVTLKDAISFGDTALGDAISYGYAMYLVNALPSAATITEAIDWCYLNWTQGNKFLPPQFANI